MRVLMLNYEYPPFGGGAASATYYMARELARRGWEVVVLTSGGHGAPALERSFGVEIHRVRSWRRGPHQAGILGAASYLFLAWFRLRRLLKDREFDLAHFYFALPTGLLSFTWRSLTGKPYIVSLRGSDVPNYDGQDFLLRTLHRLLLDANRRILRNARAVVANSQALRSLALKSFPSQRIHVITNGVALQSFSPGGRAHSAGTVVALCVARLIKRKGIEDALQALALAKNPALRLHLAGLGPARQQMQAMAEALQISDRVVFRGHLKDEDLSAAYRDANVFVLPSLSESFSMALLEAMASGLPVVATRVGGIPELVAHGENGLLVPPSDPRSLAAALDELAGSEELRLRFGRNSRRKVEKSYSWSTIVERYVTEFYAPERLVELELEPANGLEA